MNLLKVETGKVVIKCILSERIGQGTAILRGGD